LKSKPLKVEPDRKKVHLFTGLHALIGDIAQSGNGSFNGNSPKN